MKSSDLSRQLKAAMFTQYEQEHGVRLDQVLRCAANTGQTDKLYSDLSNALTTGQPIPDLGGYVRQLFASSKRHSAVSSTA